MNHLPNGEEAVGAPGSLERLQAKLRDKDRQIVELAQKIGRLQGLDEAADIAENYPLKEHCTCLDMAAQIRKRIQ